MFIDGDDELDSLVRGDHCSMIGQPFKKKHRPSIPNTWWLWKAFGSDSTSETGGSPIHNGYDIGWWRGTTAMDKPSAQLSPHPKPATRRTGSTQRVEKVAGAACPTGRHGKIYRLTVPLGTAAIVHPLSSHFHSFSSIFLCQGLPFSSLAMDNLRIPFSSNVRWGRSVFRLVVSWTTRGYQETHG